MPSSSSSVKSIAKAAVLVAGLSLPVQAMAAGACASGSAAEAMQVRALHSRLMVAALACRADAEYNAFVARFDGVLSASGRRLADWFAPRGGTPALNDYVTGLANKASLDSLGDHAGFCVTAKEIFMQARMLDDDGLIALSLGRPREEAATRDVCL